MILLSELSRRRIRSVQKLIRVGRNEVVVVLRVDKEKGLFPIRSTFFELRSCFNHLPLGYIDLSKRRVSPEDIVKCEERYMKSKTVSSILRHVASKVPSVNGEGGDPQAMAVPEPAEKENKKAARKARQAAQEEGGIIIEHEIPGVGGNEDEKLEQLYEQVAWPLGKKYGHPYDAFKLALTFVILYHFFFTASFIWFFISSEPDSVFSSLTTPVAASTLAVLISTIARRLTPQPIKLRADIELTCYTPAGIDAIKKALRSGEKQSNEAVPIKAKLVAPPLYVLSTNSTDKVYFFEKKSLHLNIINYLKQYVAVERLERAIESIQSTIESQGGNLIVKMKVMFLLY